MLRRTSQLLLRYHWLECWPIHLTRSIYTLPLIAAAVFHAYSSFHLSSPRPRPRPPLNYLSLLAPWVILANSTLTTLCQMHVRWPHFPPSSGSHLSQALPTSMLLLFHPFPRSPLSWVPCSTLLPLLFYSPPSFFSSASSFSFSFISRATISPSFPAHTRKVVPFS